MIDEGPSPEDLQRFGGHTAFCPHCGEEISDLVDRCPACGAWLTEGAARRHPFAQLLRRRWIVLMVAVMILALAGVLLVVL